MTDSWQWWKCRKNCHNVLSLGIMLLMQTSWQQLPLRLKCNSNEQRCRNTYYSYLVYLRHYYLAKYKYIIQPTIRTKWNMNGVCTTALTQQNIDMWTKAVTNRRPVPVTLTTAVTRETACCTKSTADEFSSIGPWTLVRYSDNLSRMPRLTM